tara:strand:- start:2027 stop:3358 length:1332 start_codon:yes stop_codon:yes gene_type:complete
MNKYFKRFLVAYDFLVDGDVHANATDFSDDKKVWQGYLHGSVSSLNFVPTFLTDLDEYKDYKFLYFINPYSSFDRGFGKFNKDFLLGSIPNPTLEKLINDKRFHLVIYYPNEGWVDYQSLKNIHSWFKNEGIDLNRIILINSNFKIDKWYSEFRDKVRMKSKINVAPHHWALDDVPTEYVSAAGDENQSMNMEYKIENKKYDFNFLNRANRKHRLVMLLNLYKENLLENNLVSYDLDFDESGNSKETIYECRTFDIADFHKYYDDDSEYESMISLYNKLYEKVPKKIVDFEDKKSIFGLQMETDIPYKDSMFTVVGESYFTENQNIGYISEKVFKPIAHHHPFIMIGVPGLLEYLNDLGFKTFQPYINESYDLEYNYQKRFFMILDEIKRLCNLSKTKKIEWMKGVLPIVNHNYENLKRIEKENPNIDVIDKIADLILEKKAI